MTGENVAVFYFPEDGDTDTSQFKPFLEGTKSEGDSFGCCAALFRWWQQSLFSSDLTNIGMNP